MRPGQEEAGPTTGPALKTATIQVTDGECTNPAPESLADLEDWASFTAGLHFRHDLVRVVRLRSEARGRAAQRQRRHARGAVQRIQPNRLTTDELEVQRETAKLYAQLTRLTDAGKLRWSDDKSDWVKRPVISRTDQNRPPAYTETELLDRFDKVRRSGKGWTARCTAHEDRHPSLAITEGDKGWLLKCWAGCDFADIVAGASLETQRMFFT
jgi:hypothetical protein